MIPSSGGFLPATLRSTKKFHGLVFDAGMMASDLDDVHRLRRLNWQQLQRLSQALLAGY